MLPARSPGVSPSICQPVKLGCVPGQISTRNQPPPPLRFSCSIADLQRLEENRLDEYRAIEIPGIQPFLYESSAADSIFRRFGARAQAYGPRHRFSGQLHLFQIHR